MMTINYIKILFLSLVFGLTLSSCADEIIQGFDSIPPAFGKVNAVTVLSDQMMWEGPVGDTLDYYYTGAYPITPTPESMLDLRHFNHYEITQSTVFKHYRTYIILANLGDKESPMTKMVIKDIGQEKYRQALKDPTFNTIVGKNKWAKGQILIYLFAPTESQLIDVIRSKISDITSRVYDHDYIQIIGNTFAGGNNVIAQNTLKEMMQVESKIPGDFEIAKKSLADKLIWLRKDVGDKSIENIIVRSIPYTTDKQFETQAIIDLIEDFGSKHIDENKLLVNDRDLPTYEYVRMEEGRYIKEIRGIWETKKSFMGGPYIAYLTKDPQSNNLVFALSFIYAPGESKRNLMQRSEVILKGLRSQTVEN